MPDEYISRKEYDERHTAIQIQLASITSILSSNQTQISQLATDTKDLEKSVTKLEKMVAIAATLNKILWPIVTIMGTVIGALIGFRI